MVGTVQVGSYKHLIPISPQLLCQLDSNFMGNFWGGFAGRKGLVAVIGNDTILFPVEFLDFLHLHFCGIGMAVDTGHKSLNHFLSVPHLGLTGFALLNGVVDDVGQVTIAAGNGGGFLCIFHIVQNLPNAAMDTPDRGNCHRSALHRYRIKNR